MWDVYAIGDDSIIAAGIHTPTPICNGHRQKMNRQKFVALSSLVEGLN